jgi:MFS family permease
LAGAAAAAAIVTLKADRIGRRKTLFVLALLTAAGVFPLILGSGIAVLAPVAFFGMLNGMGTDRSAAFALEQAIIPGLVSDQRRTWSLAWYNLVLDASGALGALAGGIPLVAERWWNMDLNASYRALFICYVAASLVSGGLYLFLTSQVEIRDTKEPAKVLPATRATVTKLAALFSVDSLGGGLLTDALVSYWFFRRFGVAENKLAILFFAVHVLNALSHLGAAALAKRIGLVKTMVFTHLPSSIFLIAASFAPSARWAVALFLLRESLVEMDVPTRQSYVAAMVRPSERTFASGVTNLTRNMSWAISASVAGIFMQRVSLSFPLFLGGSLKIVYDLLLWRAFRHAAPPEELGATTRPAT